MLINLDKCTGCYACQVHCKAEYELPYGTARCRVKTHRSGSYPEIKKFFLPLLCNQCDNAPCIEACEDRILSKDQSGIVLFDHESCTGCQSCLASCPYDAIEINEFTRKIERCDFCYDRLVKGEQPVCVTSCMGRAMIFGDLNDPASEISRELRKSPVLTRGPEADTKLSVFYRMKGYAGDASLIKALPPEMDNAPATAKEFPKQAMNDPVLIHTTDTMCPSECGISVFIEDGVAKKVYGNPHTLINNGALCAKGASGLQLTYSPNRIKTPLKRSGKRGEDKWEEISWKEAADYIAKKLLKIKEKYGPESVFIDTGDVTDRETYYRLFHAFGTPNTYNHGTICDPNRKWGHWLITGDERPLPDLQRPFLINNNDENELNRIHDAKLILSIGVNPFVATRFNYMSSGITSAREENDCKYIVIDPSHTNSAALADIWLPIKPGADADLLAAILYYIISNDRQDSDRTNYIDYAFVDKYTIGWQEFRDDFLSFTSKKDPANGLVYFSPEWAEEKSGIAKDKIVELAHMFGSTKPAAIEVGMHGTAHHTNGEITSMLMTALCLITGNMDRPGGLVFTSSTKPVKSDHASGTLFLEKTVTRTINNNETAGRVSGLHKDQYGDYPTASRGVLTDLPRKIREGVKIKHGPFKGHKYPVKAFFTRAGNPVITAGNTQDWTDAITSKGDNDEYQLELMVFIDTHITVTGKYADIVLPEAGFLERMGLSDVFTMSPEIAIKDRVIEPLFSSKAPFDIMNVLAKALIDNGDTDINGSDFFMKYKKEEEFIDELLSETPGLYNVGKPLPYPEIPEGSKIIGLPDNPFAFYEGKMVRKGELVTVDWLRKNNGVAVWPASYHRYRRSDGSPSGVYPKTRSGKFEFKFGHLEEINNELGTDFLTGFYWNECNWNPNHRLYKKHAEEYPFQLISGRTHHTGTMTVVCPNLSETETECARPMNDDFSYTLTKFKGPQDDDNIRKVKEDFFSAGTVSIPVFAINRNDGEKLQIKSGDILLLENPLKKKIRGKAYLTDEIMPSVIKTAFGPGGQRASGTGPLSQVSEYTPNINELHDPDNITKLTGTPGFGDIMVRIIKT